MAVTPSRLQRGTTLCWSVPAAVAGSLTVAVLLAIVGLGLTGTLSGLMDDTTPVKGLALALVPTLALTLATLVGLITGTTVVASLVRDTLAGRRGRYAAGWGRAWGTLPKVLVLGLVGVPALVVSVLGWPALPIAVVARTAWRLRSAESRDEQAGLGWRWHTGLWLAVPFAFAVTVLAALPTVWAHLVSGSTLRDAVRHAAATPLRSRLGALGGLVVLGLASWGLGALGLAKVAAPGASTGDFAAGTVVLGLTTAALIAIAGALLGFLTHTRADPPRLGPEQLRISPMVAFGRFWRPNRLTATASTAIVALLAPIVLGAVTGAASAWTEPADTDFVVTTLTDSTTVAPTACQGTNPCSLRAALSKAAAAATAGDPAVVRFGVTGTINAVATLRVGSGVTIEGNDAVTVSGQRARRVMETFAASSGEGARVVLNDFTIAGGRSTTGGAGFFSDTIRVEMAQMTFSDNVSDAGTTTVTAAARNGGAIAIPNSDLRIEQSTFSDNYARSGAGGAIAAGRLTATASTFVRNDGLATRTEGGAVYATQAGSMLTHLTVIGGGIAGTAAAPIQVVNSAVDTSARSNALACAQLSPNNGDPYSGDSVGNVDQNGTCLGTKAPVAPYEPLADNGGPTKTVALLPGSGALGAGNADICDFSDQRGTGRDASVCDAGAFQLSTATVAEVDVHLEVTPAPASPSDPVRLQATLTSDAQVPTGTVRFLDGTTVLADNITTDIYDRFVATVAPLTRGPHQITAEFTPSYTTDPPSVSDPTTLQVQTPVTISVDPEGTARVREPAVVTAHVTPDQAHPGDPAPTGVITFTNGETTDEVEVVDGTATFRTADLEQSYVGAEYSGDGYNGASNGGREITTEDVPTTTTVTLPTDPGYGAPVDIAVDVRDRVGGAHGDVRLELDGTVLQGSRTLDGGKTTFTRSGPDKLTPGPHTVRVLFDGETGWSDSSSTTQSVTVVPSTSSITLAQPRQLVWSGLYEDLGATLTGKGTATVRLLDGTKVLDERTGVDLSAGTLRFQFHVLDTEPGTHTLTAQVVPSTTATAATSAPVTLEVTKAPSYIGVRNGPAPVVGGTASISVFSRGGGAEGTLRAIDVATGDVLATAPMSSDGATLSWTATHAGTTDIKVTLTPAEDSNYLPTSATTSLGAVAAWLEAPTMSWNLVPVAGATTLTVDFADLDPAVTGMVYLRDTVSGTYLGTAIVADGHAVVNVTAAGACFCGGNLRLSYTGTGDYRDATFSAPDVTIPAWATTTTLDELYPTTPAGQSIDLLARITTQAPGNDIEGTTTFTVNGLDLPASSYLTYNHVGIARLTYTPTGPGPVRITARFTPTTSLLAPSSTSTAAVTTVSALAPPQVGMYSYGSFAVGVPVTVNLEATRNATYIADGSPLYVYDDADHLVGAGRWTANGFRTIAEVTITPAKGGPTEFTARYTYGEGTVGVSAPMSKDVTGAFTRLGLSVAPASPLRTGLPVFFTATLDTSATPGMEPGTLSLQLLANGRPVGTPATLHQGSRSVDMVAIADRRGPVTYSVRTEGDGASFGAGVGVLPLTVAGEIPSLSTDSDSVRKGRVWTSHTTAVGQAGSPKLTGPVSVSLVDESGTTRTSCSFTAPETGCAIDTSGTRLPRGLYAVHTQYHGDDFYGPGLDTGFGGSNASLRVYSESSTIRGALTPDGSRYGWQVGEQVKATWTAVDPDNAIPSGTVSVYYGGLPRCTALATAGSCSFEAPTNPRPAGDLQWVSSDATITYTPDEALPSTQVLSVRAPRRCLEVQTAVTRFDGVHVRPSVTGDAPCVRPGIFGGFLEGTTVHVKIADGLAGGWQVKEWKVTSGEATSTLRGAEDSGDKVSFTISDATSVVAVVEWAPQCVTVFDDDSQTRREMLATGLPPERLPDFRDQGIVELKTPSNCSDPFGHMSTDEQADFKLGIGHYAVGTDISATATGLHRPITAWNPRYIGIGVDGLDAPDATHPFSHKVVTKDLRLFGKYVVDPVMCTPVNLYAGVGGTLEVLSTKKHWRMQGADSKGRCLTADAKPGFWAFSTIEVKATPKSPRTREGYFQNRWFDGDELSTPAKRAENLAAQGVTEFPEYSDPALLGRSEGREPGYWRDLYISHNNYNPQFHGFTVPLRTSADATADLGVGFAEVRCMQLNLRVHVPQRSADDQGRPKVSVTAPNCGPRQGYGWNAKADPERGQVISDQVRWGRATFVGRYTRDYDGTGYYTPGTKVTVTIDKTAVSAQTPGQAATDFALTPGTSPRTLLWRTSTSPALTGARESTAASVEMTMDHDQWLQGDFTPSSCRTPNVKVRPAGIGGGYTIDDSSYGACPDGKADPAVRTTLNAKPVASLQPVWTMGKQLKDGESEVPYQAGYGQANGSESSWVDTWVKNRQFEFNDTTAKYNAGPHLVELYYCGQLNVDVTLRGLHGAIVEDSLRKKLGVLNGVDAKDLLRNGGTCPAPMMALPGTSVQVGPTGDALRRFEVGGMDLNGKRVPDGQLPSMHVNADGTSTDTLQVYLRPRCFTLELGSNVSTSTQPNCPGAEAGEMEYLPGTVAVVEAEGKNVDKFKGWNGVDKVSSDDEKVAAVMMNNDRDVSANYDHPSGIELATKIISNIEQRVVSALVSAVSGAVTGFLFVVQVASLAVSGIAEGLSALGVEGAAIDKMKDVGNAIQAGIDMVNAVADCTQTWATGDGAPPFSPGSDLADQGIGVGTDVLGDAIDGDKRINHAGGAVLEAYSLTTMFATGIEAYLQEPSESWANIVDIGSCVAQKGRDVGNAVVKVGR